MIFIGCNDRISFGRWYDHHSRWTDSRCLPRFIRIWWNKLKEKNPIYQIVEYTIGYSKPYCKRCMMKFIETKTFSYYNGIKNPTRQDRINIVHKLRERHKFL